MGRLIVAVSAAVEALPSVGRVQLAKYGDGGAHLHLFFLARPARMLQLRGSPLLDWEENLPPVPLEVARANAEFVADACSSTRSVARVRPGADLYKRVLYDAGRSTRLAACLVVPPPSDTSTPSPRPPDRTRAPSSPTCWSPTTTRSVAG